MASRRIKHARIDPADKLARTLDLPESQIGRGNLRLVDVVNHSDDEQRSMLRRRAGEADRGSNKARQTVRKLTKMEKLYRAGIINEREAKACQWYANAHAMRYDTTGTTANYGESSGCPRTDFDHMPKTKPQWEALEHYTSARQAICPTVRPMFERVVIHGRPLGKLAITFRMTAQRLLEHIEGKVAL